MPCPCVAASHCRTVPDARLTPQASYKYAVTGPESQYLKPQTVLEAEFNLSDEVVPPAAIALAPSGKLMSTQYELALNSVVPKVRLCFMGAPASSPPTMRALDQAIDIASHMAPPHAQAANSDFRAEQEKIRAWLLTDVEVNAKMVQYKIDNAGGTGETLEGVATPLRSSSPAGEGEHKGATGAPSPDRIMSLMELHQLLLEKYDLYRAQWNQKKADMLAKAVATGDKQAEEDYFRHLAVIGLSKERDIQGYWNTLVVCGYHHRVQEALAYVDVTTAAELQEQAKARLRAAEMSSIYGAKSVYPVLMQPDNWADLLSTSFTPKDLLMDPEMVMNEAKQLQSDIRTLASEQALLQSQKQGDVGKLEKAVIAARKAFNEAQNATVEAYGSAVATAAKMYLDAEYGAGGAKASVTQGLKDKILAAAGAPISDADINKIFQGWKETGEAQLNLEATSERYSEVRAALATAHTTDFASAVAQLETAIQQKQSRLRALKDMMAVAGPVKAADAVSCWPPLLSELVAVATSHARCSVCLHLVDRSPRRSFPRWASRAPGPPSCCRERRPPRRPPAPCQRRRATAAGSWTCGLPLAEAAAARPRQTAPSRRIRKACRWTLASRPPRSPWTAPCGSTRPSSATPLTSPRSSADPAALPAAHLLPTASRPTL